MKKDPYLVLGIKPTASQEEKEKAYKRLRSQYHPDRGGDPKKFNELLEAWDEIKDKPPHDPNQGYERTVNYRSAHFTDGVFHRRQHANQYVNIEATVSVNKAVNGGRYTLEIHLANTGSPYRIEIDVPPGVQDGEVIRYPRMLLNMIDVNVTFKVLKDKVWSIEGVDLIKKETFDVWDLILGTTRDVTTIKNTKVRVVVPPMTQPGTKLRLRSYGAPSRQNFLQKGDMYVEIQAKIPDPISDDLLEAIKAAKR